MCGQSHYPMCERSFANGICLLKLQLRCAIARGPAKLNVVDDTRISPYRIIAGKAEATVAPSQLNGWALSTLMLGEIASPSQPNLVVLPDPICEAVDRWQASGGGRIITPQAGLEVGFVFDYRSSSEYSVAGVRTLSDSLALGSKHEAFLRINGTEVTCTVYCQSAGVLIGTPWVWRCGEYVFAQLPTASQSVGTVNIPYAGLLTLDVTKSGLFAHAPASGQGQLGLWSKGPAIQCFVVAARRHNYRLPVDHKHYGCTPAVGTLEQPITTLGPSGVNSAGLLMITN